MVVEVDGVFRVARIEGVGEGREDGALGDGGLFASRGGRIRRFNCPAPARTSRNLDSRLIAPYTVPEPEVPSVLRMALIYHEMGLGFKLAVLGIVDG